MMNRRTARPLFIAFYFCSLMGCKGTDQDSASQGSSANDALTYELILKINVSDLKKSTVWYVENLGMIENTIYSSPTWTQLFIPGVKNAELGLQVDPRTTNTGSTNITLVVPNIATTKAQLEAKGVRVSPVQEVGEGVTLAYFHDLDGNTLVLRQQKNQIAQSLPTTRQQVTFAALYGSSDNRKCTQPGMVLP